MPVPREDPEALPDPSPELILISVLVQAHLKHLTKKQRQTFLQEVTDALDWQSENRNIIRIRPRSQDEAVNRARRSADAWWRRALGLFVTHAL